MSLTSEPFSESLHVSAKHVFPNSGLVRSLSVDNPAMPVKSDPPAFAPTAIWTQATGTLELLVTENNQVLPRIQSS